MYINTFNNSWRILIVKVKIINKQGEHKKKKKKKKRKRKRFKEISGKKDSNNPESKS